MDELQNAGDRDFVVEVYRDNVWKVPSHRQHPTAVFINPLRGQLKRH